MRLKQYLIENALKQHIDNMLKLMADKPGHEFWVWQKKNAKIVKPKSYKSNPKLEEIVSKFLVVDQPIIKQCHRNSLMIAAHNKQIDVVSGYTTALGAVPIVHTWNYYKPAKIHFDLTGEICLKRRPGTELYLEIVKLNAKQAFKIMSTTQFEISGVLGTYFTKYM